MLTHPTLNRLVTLGLTGMAKAFDEHVSFSTNPNRSVR